MGDDGHMAEIDCYIQRKTMLYKTGVEYGDYTMNFVQGCSHGCKYPCYAYLQKKRFGQVDDYNDWCKPKLISNTLALLDKEIPRLKDKIKSVQLCFSTDPFMYGYKEVENMAIESIKKIKCRRNQMHSAHEGYPAYLACTIIPGQRIWYHTDFFR